MTDVQITAESAAGWSITSDTTAPEGGGAWVPGHPALLAPLTTEWKIAEVMPPVAVPATMTLLIYDDGLSGEWISLDVGDAVGVYVTVDGRLVVPFQGKITDVSGTAWTGGGMIFQVVLADRLGDLGGINAPAVLDSGSAAAVYDTLKAWAGIDFDEDIGANVTRMNAGSLCQFIADMPTEGMTVLDVLNRLVSMDCRYDSPNGLPANLLLRPLADVEPIYASYQRPRYLAFDVDEADVTPPTTPAYRLVQLPRQVDPDEDTIAGVLEFDYTVGARPWVLAGNLDYYDGSRTGLVLDASNVAAQVGEWRKTIRSAINTAEINHSDTGSFPPDGVSYRNEFVDLVAAYGRVIRSIDVWTQTDDDLFLAWVLLGPRDQVASGYGFQGFTVAWETLSEDAKDAWAESLWPVYTTPQRVVYGRPVAIANVPADWLLSESPVAGGRLTGISYTIVGTRVRLAVSMTGKPPTRHTGLTFVGVDAIEAVEGHLMTYATIDTQITVDDFGLVED